MNPELLQEAAVLLWQNDWVSNAWLHTLNNVDRGGGAKTVVPDQILSKEISVLIEQIEKTLNARNPQYFLVGITAMGSIKDRKKAYAGKTRDFYYPMFEVIGNLAGYPIDIAFSLEKKLFEKAKDGHNFKYSQYNPHKLTGNYRPSAGGKSSDPSTNEEMYVLYVAGTDNPAKSCK